MAKIQLSFLIVNYECGDYLGKCLESLFKIVTQIDFEVIVVDNASTDESIKHAQSLNLPVQWIRLPENLGFGRANNLGMTKASGEYLLLLNPDTELLMDCVTPLLTYIINHPEVGLVGGHHQDQFGVWQRSFGLPPRIHYEFEYALTPARYWSRLPSESPKVPIEVGWLYGSFVLIRHDLAQRIGLFDERFFLNDEDIDLAERVRKAGLKIIYHPSRGLKHYGGISKALSPTSFREYRRSRRAYYNKKSGRVAELIYIIAAFLRQLRDIISTKKRGWSRHS